MKQVKTAYLPVYVFDVSLSLNFDGHLGYRYDYIAHDIALSKMNWYSRKGVTLECDQERLLAYAGSNFPSRLMNLCLLDTIIDKMVQSDMSPWEAFSLPPEFALRSKELSMADSFSDRISSFLMAKPSEYFYREHIRGPFVTKILPSAHHVPPNKVRHEKLLWNIEYTDPFSMLLVPFYHIYYSYGRVSGFAVVNGTNGDVNGVRGAGKMWQLKNFENVIKNDADELRKWSSDGKNIYKKSSQENKFKKSELNPLHWREMDDYEILGLRNNSAVNISGLRLAFRQQAQLWHPDKHSNATLSTLEECSERFKRIQSAFVRLRLARK